jgi:hypothetical protein
VAVSVVDVVDVVVVRDGHVAALGPVLVVMTVVCDMVFLLALVHMTLVEAVHAPVVDIVDVIAMRDGHVPAARSVLMSVISVLTVFGGNGHVRAPCRFISEDQLSVGC